MGLLQKIRVVWQGIGLVERALLTALVLTGVIVSGLVIHWARMPELRLLYEDLSREEASKIAEKLDEEDITYELRSGGRSIYVPRERVYQLRLDMARKGLPVDSQSGYRIFDDEKVGVSPFVQSVNLQRALQEELAKSIQMIDGVVHVRVHIVAQRRSVFNSGGGETTASVVLRLKPGYHLSGSNIAAITHLVAGSVEALQSENVTVVDSHGRLLSSESDSMVASGARMVQDYRERVEEHLAEKAEDMLAAVLGPGRASVRVSVMLDMSSRNLVKESYDPSGKVVSREETKTNSEQDPGQVGGEGKQGAAGGKKEDEEIVTEYKVGKTVEETMDLPGQVQGLSVAAFVDLSVPDTNEAQAAGQGGSIMELSEVEEIIRNALGLKETDSLKVVEARFNRPVEPIMEEEGRDWSRYIAIARQVSLGVVAICALGVLRILGGRKAKASAAVGAGSEQLAHHSESAGLLPGGQAGEEGSQLRRRVALALQSNPEQAKRLFSSWVEEEG